MIAFLTQFTFVAAVRKSRYTHELIEGTGEFTVSIPSDRSMKEALAFCGTKSGREHHKFEELNLTAIPTKVIDSYVLGECKFHLEC